MTDWTSGYVADIGYTYGYYPELNPQRLKLAFLNSGLSVPSSGSACELGFGQGLSANLHAAASVTQWSGTDFNPSQAGFAQELASVADSDAKLYDQAFSEFCGRSDLPDFDFIGLHGIWSWISEENRTVIVDFIRRKLKVGGVLYISYNTLPGWAPFAPIRHLLTEHAEIIGSEGHGIVSRIDGALLFAEKLLATNPSYALANPQIGERIKKIKGQNRHYLAHEYFNRDWHPMHFSTMAEWLSSAKLDYACSAHYLDHLDAINLFPEQQAFLKEIPDPMFRETVRDFMVNQQFRRDYWVKGVRKLSSLEQTEALRKLQVILMTNPADIPLQVTGSCREASLSAAVYEPIFNVLADYKPRSIGQIEQAVQEKRISLQQILQAALVLTGTNHLAMVQDDLVISQVKRKTDKLNVHLLNKARSSGDINFLASPVIGGGVNVSRIDQLFLLALKQGKSSTAEWARFAWDLLSMQGQKLLKEGKPLEGMEDNLVELEDQAASFATKQLPILKALQIV
ncbi:class I SAM-dependent methyltransferase [Noviherbaspirillum sp.]|mgnify:CR=1 FL=1|jgi:SAM-dependent methyltransferase|uniref:class I SAM-dependent methyltransferase n=1 Tax=Noviherbaspirillum sp. TaxID=1926288 RepID=UPI0025EB56A2|nr:class I SAM-dependent methyltransferase [Noviherbaspirillum sp.]